MEILGVKKDEFFIKNKITRSLNTIFVDKKYDVIILSYYIFNFTY